MSEFQVAQINIPNGQSRRLISEKSILINKKEFTENHSFWEIKPYTISLVLLLIGIIITVWDFTKSKHFKAFDSFLFILTGLAGFIIVFMMFFSIQPLVKMNLNILWLNPLNLFVGILIWVRRLRIFLFFYQIFNMTLFICALFVFALSAQLFNVAAFPIIVLLLLRSASSFAYLKRRIYKHRSV
jgi:hypothetical protein